MKYIPAAHHSSGSNVPPTRIVVHATCPDIGFPSASRKGRAVSTARYFQSSGASGSAHYVCDIGETVQCLSENTIGWHAPPNGHSIGVEICADGGSKASFRDGSHAYTRSQWLSPQVWPAVERAAILTAQLCNKYGIPKTRITAGDLRNGRKGVCGHVDVSNAFHQSDHDDPGPYFPWNEFMQVVNGRRGRSTSSQEKDLTMADINTLTKLIASAKDQAHYDAGSTQKMVGDLRKRVDDLSWVKNPVTGKLWRTKDALWSVWYYVLEMRNRVHAVEGRLSEIEKKVK